MVRPEGYVGLVPARSDSELVLAAVLSLSLRNTREHSRKLIESCSFRFRDIRTVSLPQFYSPYDSPDHMVNTKWTIVYGPYNMVRIKFVHLSAGSVVVGMVQGSRFRMQIFWWSLKLKNIKMVFTQIFI